jgi:hypothetical protein
VIGVFGEIISLDDFSAGRRTHRWHRPVRPRPFLVTLPPSFIQI